MTTMILTGDGCGMTAVPNGFLDRYMPEADGEYVKIYLLLWRYFCDKKSISTSQLADLLDHTEKDVLRGIRYWVKKGLLQAVVNDQDEIYSIRFLPVPEADTKKEMAMASSQPEQKSQTDLMLQNMQNGQIAQRETAVTAEMGSSVGSSKTAASHSISKDKRKELAADEEFGQLVYIVRSEERRVGKECR